MHPAYANDNVYYLLITQKDQIWSHDLESKISVEISKHAKVTVYASIEEWSVSHLSSYATQCSSENAGLSDCRLPIIQKA